MVHGLSVLWLEGSFQIRDQICVSCIDGKILYHKFTREAPPPLSLGRGLHLLRLWCLNTYWGGADRVHIQENATALTHGLRGII